MADRVIKESSKRITCGWMGYANHKGVDLGWRQDESQNEVHANCKGVVETVVDGLDTMPISASSWGNYVLVKHPNGMFTRYCHLRKGTVKVKRGQAVDENTVLGIIGESGSVKGRHLHFEVQKTVSASTRINPTPYLSKPVYEEPKFLKMRGHVQKKGWQEWNDKSVGTTGLGLRLEAIQIDASFVIEAKAHIQKKGWIDYGKINKNAVIGTTGQGLRLECLCLKGNFEYRVHIQKKGWTSWNFADGKTEIGTTGQGLRLEAIEFRLK